MPDSTLTVIVGIGNEFRRDDGVGLHVARLIQTLGLDNVRVVSGIAEGTALLDIWDHANRSYVIDCAVSGSEPGVIHRFDVDSHQIPADIFNGYSTHNISVTDAVELARALGRLPEHLTVIGIEGGDFAAGMGLSAEVALAAQLVVEDIVTEIGNGERPTG